MQTAQETIINVPEIEPRLKHATIFETFDALEPGDSLIIHNDHDPKPLYYQLAAQRGHIFKWEYLQQGPQWWDIRVTKYSQDAAAPDNNGLLPGTEMRDGDVVINVPRIEPPRKHATIFQVFDSLQPGKSLIIHNDHDPKPVYYQLLGERGDVFTWQYLQQGPQWWDIRVTRKEAGSSDTVGQIAAKDLRKAEVFKKYGIDFCCGGKKTVREVCAEKGIDATKVEQELQQTNSGSFAGVTHAYNEWKLDFLADYVINTHHAYVRKYLPELRGFALKVARVHGGRHPELMAILHYVEEIAEELTEHMDKEERMLFPAVKRIVQAKAEGTSLPEGGPKLQQMIDVMEHEHDEVGRAYEAIREQSNNFALPEDACTSYKLYFQLLQEFESDLHLHVHLENNILFPKAAEMEQSMAA
jgi:regulator of cell morphogenesis and NO signaling